VGSIFSCTFCHVIWLRGRLFLFFLSLCSIIILNFPYLLLQLVITRF
jgi:hypothetical protein